MVAISHQDDVTKLLFSDVNAMEKFGIDDLLIYDSWLQLYISEAQLDVEMETLDEVIRVRT